MENLTAWIEPVAVWSGVPLQYLLLLSLFLIGVVGHWFIRTVVRKLAVVSDRTDARWDDVVVYSISPPAEWVMWVCLIYLSVGLFEQFDALRHILLQVGDTALALVLGWLFHRLITGIELELLAEHRGPRESTDRATINAVARLVRICIWIVVALMALQTLGLSVSGLLAFGGIGGIAVGFAAKDVLANFLGGLSIYMDRPFAIGDWIRSPDREIEGTVEHIGWRMTRIRTFDQRPLYVPNAIFSNVAIENPSRMRNRRIYETIGIRYADANHMAAIVAAVRSMLEQHEAIDLERTLIVNFVSFGPSSLDFFVYTFTKTKDWVTYHEIKQDVMLKILAIVESHGAEVAFPTQTLHLEQMVESSD